MHRHSLITFLFALALACASELTADQPTQLPDATAQKLPRFRGFNLTNKFHLAGRNGPFLESDFQWIRELGFNFVRLPMDYRVWIKGDDWTKFNEKTLREIDQAVEWGGRYNIHVMINFHRAPGYTVAKPPEAKSLWKDAEAQQVCAAHWAMFARRYRKIDNRHLSFNLFNEPAGVDEAAYVEVVRKIVAAIRQEDPKRLIVSDGLEYGKRPCMGLADLGLAQATRGYVPMDVSHHQASWAGGTPEDPIPVWPRPRAQGMLYSPHKAGMHEDAKLPLVIRGPFPEQSLLRLRVAVVSAKATLVVSDGSRELWSRQFVCGPGEGEWEKAVHVPRWNSYQNIYNKNYTVPIPAGAQQLQIQLAGGDWLRLSELAISSPGRKETVLPLLREWGKRPAVVSCLTEANSVVLQCNTQEDRAWLKESMIEPWQKAERAGIGVMVGEFGCYNKTPHDVALRWLEDSLANWKEAGWGWALWNFRGSFGILDSGRPDVEYVDFRGHKLDQKLLDLLQRY